MRSISALEPMSLDTSKKMVFDKKPLSIYNRQGELAGPGA
jgi:hypothetical protein